MTEKPPININLDEVTESYEIGLVDKLRQFGVKGDLFETWVPDPNPAKSIINLMNASRDAGLPENLIITASRQIVDQVALESLQSELDGRAHIEIVDQENSVIIHLSKFGGMGGSQFSIVEGLRRPSVVESPLKAKTGKDRITPQGVGGSVSDNARQSGKNILYDLSDQVPFSRKGSISNEQGFCVIAVEQDGYVIELQVDVSSHLVEKAMFNGSVPKGLAPLLNRLCESIENRQIQDMSDHAVARLEYKIRSTGTRPVPGIVLPPAVDDRFARLQVLVRKALAKYREATGYWEISNTFDDEAEAEWLELSSVEKKEKSEEILRKVVKKLGFDPTEIDVLDVEYSVRVLVRFSGSLAKLETDKQQIMMQLEQALVDYLDPRLELFLEPVQDQSTLRRLSGED